MEITVQQYERIAHCLPKPRRAHTVDNVRLLNAFLFVLEHGCKWRGLPKEFGNWHTIYTRMNRWAKSGVLARVFECLQRENIIGIEIKVLCLDSTCVKVHPDATGALKKTAHSPSDHHGAARTPRFIWLPQMIERP
jgi:transposase